MQTTKKRTAESGCRMKQFSGFLARGSSGGSSLFWFELQPGFKSPAAPLLWMFSALCLFLSGCGPAGPRAVLDGKKYLERGDYSNAIEELRSATQLMPTNALAFSYLGLAYHQAGQVAEAERAYLRALALDHDLTEVHYDLGCLWLSQSNKLDQAKSALTVYTMRQPNSPEGWLKLGQAQLRSRELAAAERSFGEGLRTSPQNPEILTAMGLVRYQRHRPNEAVLCFSKALKERPNYAPAILNLAIIAQQDQADPRLALQRYREYLKLSPPPEHAESVGAIVRQLEQELNPAPRELVTNQGIQPLPQSTNSIANTLKTAEPTHPPATSKPNVTNASRPPVVVKSEPTNANKALNPTNTAKLISPSGLAVTDKLEAVRLGAEPQIKAAEDLGANTVPASAGSKLEAPVESSSTSLSSSEPKTSKKGFFQKINPMNLFGHDGKPTTSSPNGGNPPLGTNTLGAPSGSDNLAPRNFPRYVYRSPAKPAPGNRDLAEKAFSEGVQHQQARQLSEAIQAYRQAAQADPSFYDAHYNLGLAASDNGNLPLALAAYETALAVEPESLDARYNFGLVLKQSGYVLDAVSQFEKILAKYPNDGRTHLALGNLYAQQLQDTAKARQQYQAVLTIAPQSPQAGAIRYWLSDHPK